MSHRCDRILKSAPVMATHVGRALAPQRHKHLWNFWIAPQPCGVQEPGHSQSSGTCRSRRSSSLLITLSSERRLSLACQPWEQQRDSASVLPWPAKSVTEPNAPIFTGDSLLASTSCLSFCKKKFQTWTFCVRSPGVKTPLLSTETMTGLDQKGPWL